jgi:hypothetical protein
MYKKIDIDELYKQKAEIYELYKTDRKFYHNEYDKILKKIRYWTDETYRKNKNENDNLRITINRFYNKHNKNCIKVA